VVVTPDADTSQRISTDAVHAQRLTALESATAKATADITVLDRHRERMETRWALVAAFAGAVAGLAAIEAW
jgi:adenine deaminase